MKKFKFAIAVILTMLLFAWAGMQAQAVRLGFNPKFQAFDNNGNPLSGGKLYTYAEGTSTPKTTYADVALASPNANPVVLDSRGEATVFLVGAYKFVLTTSADVTVWTVDGIRGADFHNIVHAGDSLASVVSAAGATATTILVDQANTLTDSLTVPLNIKLWIVKGGSVTVPTTKTLTINGTLDAGRYQVFTLQGTGTVAFGVGSVDKVFPEWWGAVADGATDCATPLGNALTAATTPGVPVSCMAGTYALGSAVNLKPNTWIEGQGYKTVFKPTANTYVFTSDVDLSSRAGQVGYIPLLRNLLIDSSANGNNITLLYFDRDLHMRTIEHVGFKGNSGATQTAIHWYHTNPDTRANWCYHNTIINCDFSNFDGANGVIYLQGDGPTNRRANNNLITNNRFTGFKIAVKIGGSGNEIGPGNVFNSSDSPVLVNNTGGTDFRIVIYDGSFANRIFGNWIEQGSTDVIVKSTGQGTASVSPSVEFGFNSGLADDGQVADLALSDGNHYGHTATYVDTDTFTVAGDETSTYPVGRKVWVDCGADGWRSTTVSAVAYTTLTTVDLTNAILTANLATSSTTSAFGFRPNLPGYNPNEMCWLRVRRLYVGDTETKYLTKAMKGSTAIDFPNVNAGAEVAMAMTATGVVAGMTASVSPSTDITGLVIKSVRVSATDEITVMLYNYTGSPIDLGTITMRWAAFDGA